uniref:Uncharacterized protein n=2 Tax=Arundo donax TaxID=35708 RepID=A0A0A8XRR6_ARUDO
MGAKGGYGSAPAGARWPGGRKGGTGPVAKRCSVAASVPEPEEWLPPAPPPPPPPSPCMRLR